MSPFYNLTLMCIPQGVNRYLNFPRHANLLTISTISVLMGLQLGGTNSIAPFLLWVIEETISFATPTKYLYMRRNDLLKTNKF